MGQITEVSAKIYMSERSWDLAEKAFQKAINYFQVNDFKRALVLQKYRVFAFMLGGQEIIFDTPEAYIYVKDPDIAAVCKLIRGFKEFDIQVVKDALKRKDLINDPLIGVHIQKMLDFCLMIKEI